MNTPLTQLILFMDNIAISKDVDLDLQNAITQLHTHIQKKVVELLEAEKNVIIEAYNNGKMDCLKSCEKGLWSGEQYYNNKFNNK